MMRRVVIVTVLVLSIAALLAIAIWTHETRLLAGYRQQIEARFAPAIALIEESSRTLPERIGSSEGERRRREAIMDDIQRSLSASEIVAAAWTSDGHHGSESLRPWSTNIQRISINPIFRTRDASGLHSLSFGESDKGQALLIYEGWVPNGRKRHYTITFLLEQLQKR